MPYKKGKIAFLFLISTTVVIGIILLIVVLFYRGSNTKISSNKQNFTLLSTNITDKLKYSVNNSIEPCVDFYGYACSSVIDVESQKERLRLGYSIAFNNASERLFNLKKNYIMDLIQRAPQTVIEEEIKDYCLACMNSVARKKEELTYVTATRRLLKKITTREEFINMLANNITNPSRLSFISANVDLPNLDRPSYQDLSFDVNLMSLPHRSYYENKKLADDLKTVIEQFFIAIGEDNPKKKARLVFNFEKALSQQYPTPLKINEHLYSRTEISRKNLTENYPYLKLKKFLSNIPGHVVIRNIIGDQTMGFLNEKLKTSSLEELKSVYLYFQLSPIMDEAYPAFFIKRFEFNKKHVGGVYRRANRQEQCVVQVMNDFAKELDFILLPKFLPGFPKDKIIKLVEKIRHSLIKQLTDNTWLDNNTKKEAIKKIRNVRVLTISPSNEEEWNFNPKTTYAKDQPIANRHKLAKLLLDKKLAELNGPVNIKRWPIGPLSVNAAYNWSYNRIIIPIGILQYPFYDPTEPEEVNLGAIGAFIGHELGHAIDDYGNRFNANGVLKQWVAAKDKEIFDKKTQYLIDQFDKINHNGKLTLAENIADLVGLTIAYQAAFPNEKMGNQELKKRFFLQFARLWCEIHIKELANMRLKTDRHSLGHARINEQMKHQIGFNKAYNCKPSDPMVISEDKIVKIW